MFAKLNYGFRHFLPAYIFLLMWCGRAISNPSRAMTVIAVACAFATALHATSFHPDYLSYVNFPRDKVWMQMTDSNLDWDQATRQIGPWLDRHPQRDRIIHVVPRSGRAGYVGPYYLGDRVHFVDRGKPPPTDGILIISPVWVSGVYDLPDQNPYQFLQSREPIDTIGHALLVYDLERK
jgi:hypothetical protein